MAVVTIEIDVIETSDFSGGGKALLVLGEGVIMYSFDYVAKWANRDEMLPGKTHRRVNESVYRKSYVSGCYLQSCLLKNETDLKYHVCIEVAGAEAINIYFDSLEKAKKVLQEIKHWIYGV